MMEKKLNKSKFVGLDLGSKTLGVALSDEGKKIAFPYENFFYKNEDYNILIDYLKKLIENQNIEKIILGFPKLLNNDIGPRAQKSLQFKQLINDNLKIEVILFDERFTTKIAQASLIKADVKRKKRKQVIDKIAAVYILQDYLDMINK